MSENERLMRLLRLLEKTISELGEIAQEVKALTTSKDNDAYRISIKSKNETRGN